VKAGFWRADWVPGVALTLVALVAAALGGLRGLEWQLSDVMMSLIERAPSAQVAVIAIDETSLAALGAWPWPRAVQARLIDILAGAKPRLIGSTLLFAEAERDPAAPCIDRLADIVERASAPPPLRAELLVALAEARAALAGDARLAESYASAGNVLLPLRFAAGDGGGAADSLPPWAADSHLARIEEGGGSAPAVAGPRAPLAMLGSRALALGHLNAFADADGRVRSEALAVRFGDRFFPSLALALAGRARDPGGGDIRVRLGEWVRVGDRRIRTDEATRMQPFFYRGTKERPAFAADSFQDVLSGRIPAARYAGKIVLIGATAPGIEAPLATPAGTMAPVEFLAHTLSSILEEHGVAAPGWGVWAGYAALALVGLYLALALPRLGIAAGLLATLALLLALLGAQAGLLLGAGLWLPLGAAAGLLLLGHLLLAARPLFCGRAARCDGDSPVSDRALGVALQGQGLLDLAFDRFRQCPMDGALLENLYALGRDYERHGQRDKAVTVYRLVAERDPAFRDIASRLLWGGEQAGAPIPPPRPARAAIGGYRLERELGKGAMGVVYLAHDPQGDRQVAIKTLALASEFERDELDNVKQRFFREAETAGRLEHPHIVAVFGAGEEDDLAYIVMEYLAGADLTPYCQPDARLPLATALSIAARVADALDYAHGQQVVHRDIKPANIMYEPASDRVKVTDFGVARITDSSRTKTGVVLGTPSYMSPEQLAGKKIDGRSDIYSLGVALYQLCCGQLPFSGASLAQLMYKIANDPAPDIRDIEPSLPREVAAVIAKTLAKNAAQRYQRAASLAADLRRCLARLPAREEA